mmetsp:Transcript_26544/g.82022  ORF Transcript_26544/g.82022 Transcript_26544/m.82022 type:complete len:589 (-) Transcript_26544:39-1805(-)
MVARVNRPRRRAVLELDRLDEVAVLRVGALGLRQKHHALDARECDHLATRRRVAEVKLHDGGARLENVEQVRHVAHRRGAVARAADLNVGLGRCLVLVLNVEGEADLFPHRRAVGARERQHRPRLRPLVVRREPLLVGLVHEAHAAARGVRDDDLRVGAGGHLDLFFRLRLVLDVVQFEHLAVRREVRDDEGEVVARVDIRRRAEQVERDRAAPALEAHARAVGVRLHRGLVGDRHGRGLAHETLAVGDGEVELAAELRRRRRRDHVHGERVGGHVVRGLRREVKRRAARDVGELARVRRAGGDPRVGDLLELRGVALVNVVRRERHEPRLAGDDAEAARDGARARVDDVDFDLDDDLACRPPVKDLRGELEEVHRARRRVRRDEPRGVALDGGAVLEARNEVPTAAGRARVELQLRRGAARKEARVRDVRVGVGGGADRDVEAAAVPCLQGALQRHLGEVLELLLTPQVQGVVRRDGELAALAAHEAALAVLALRGRGSRCHRGHCHGVIGDREEREERANGERNQQEARSHREAATSLVAEENSGSDGDCQNTFSENATHFAITDTQRRRGVRVSAALSTGGAVTA